MKDENIYLIHIAECIQRIEAYTQEGKEAFLTDTKTQDAVLRNLQTLAESTRYLPDSLKASIPGVDWNGIAAFRNVVVHDYLGIDTNQIWDIVEHDLPDLKRKIEPALKQRGLKPEPPKR